MKKPEPSKTRFLLIVLGVIVAIIISLQTSAFSFQEFHNLERVDMMTESSKKAISHVNSHMINVFISTLKNI